MLQSPLVNARKLGEFRKRDNCGKNLGKDLDFISALT